VDLGSTSDRLARVTGYPDRQRLRRRATWDRWTLVFACGYLVFLGYPIAAEVLSDRNPFAVGLSLAGCALFVAVDVWFWTGIGRHVPRRSMVALSLLSALAAALGLHSPNWLLSFIYCGVLVGTCLAFPWALAGLAGLIGLFLAVAVVDGSLPQSSLEWSVYLLSTVLSVFGAMGIRKVFEANFSLEAAREELARLAVAEERLRFARDLHDLLGHSLSLIVLKAELAGRLAGTNPERAAGEIRDVERVAREALREVRDAVAGYRQLGLEEELERAHESLTAAGIEARCDRHPGPLPTPVATTLAWAVREGVTNVLRHSRARAAEIRVRRFQGQVQLELLDDGLGGDAGSGGSGLRGLSERVLACRGGIEFGNRPEGGFRLAVRLPLHDPVLPSETPT
jgi:two-component system sensor histidine kinase DesK